MTPWEEPGHSGEQDKQIHGITWTYKGSLLPDGLPPSSPPPLRTGALWQDTCLFTGGCLARGLEFTEHSPACCGNNSEDGAGRKSLPVGRRRTCLG